ncbi:S-adenosyl-L-methionine-dependent methyltransferase [Scleroderma citrinum]
MLPPSTLGRDRTQDADAAVRQTDADAALARLSAVRKGYLTDPFIGYLVPRAQLQSPRPPLINIGTYVRSYSIDHLTEQWMNISKKEHTQCQIVSLGSGSDSRFWRIATGPCKDQLRVYIELDFPEVTTKKAMSIRKSRELNAVLGSPESVTVAQGGMALHSPKYHLLPCDLRKSPTEVLPPLLVNILSPTYPTLLLFECVLVYMSPEASSTLIQWFVDYFRSDSHTSEVRILGALVYEMFSLQDSFGQVMVSNLRSRNVSLPGAIPYGTLQSLPERFSRHNFTTSKALTLREIREKHVAQSELERISTLEMLDEVEELNLVLEHYAITWGAKLNGSPDLANSSWLKWGLTRKQDVSDEYK